MVAYCPFCECFLQNHSPNPSTQPIFSLVHLDLLNDNHQILFMLLSRPTFELPSNWTQFLQRLPLTLHHSPNPSTQPIFSFVHLDLLGHTKWQSPGSFHTSELPSNWNQFIQRLPLTLFGKGCERKRNACLLEPLWIFLQVSASRVVSRSDSLCCHLPIFFGKLQWKFSQEIQFQNLKGIKVSPSSAK